MSDARWPAALVLENGKVFRGEGFGARVESIGEVVFNTSITGYQEIVSDPSYAGQIVVMTAPQIGNVGVNRDDIEARSASCAPGLAIRELSPIPASWRAEDTLPHWLDAVAACPASTASTRARSPARCAIRARCAARSRRTSTEIDAVLERVRAAPKMDGLDLVPARHVQRSATSGTSRPGAPTDDGRALPCPPIEFHVVAYDFGIKENILRQLRDIGARVTVVPATTPARDALALGADGFFLSNGPGDPAAVDYGDRRDARAVRERQAGVRHLPRPSDPRPRARRADVQAAVRSPRRQPPGARQDDRQGRDHVAEPRVRRRSERRCRRACTSRTRTCSITRTRASPSPASRSSACSTTPRRARARTTRATCSRGSATRLKRSGDVSARPRSSTQVIEELYARHTADTEAAGRRAPRVRGAPRQGPPGRRAVGGVERRVRRVVRRRARRCRAACRRPRSRRIASCALPAMRARRLVRVARHVAAQPVRGPRDGARAASSCSICSAAPSSTSTSSARCTASRSAMSPSCGSSVAPAARSGSAARSSITRRRRAARSSSARARCSPRARSRRDVIDQIAQLRVQVTRYRHMAPARVYELGSRIMG